MPKGKKHGRNGVMGRNEDQVCRYVGRFYSAGTASARVIQAQLNPLALDARLVTVSDAWQEYRFTKVKARGWLGNILEASPSVTPGGANLALAYSPNILGSAPISVAECQNLQDFAVGNGTIGCPYPRLTIGAKGLLAGSPVKWFRRGTPFDDTLEVQGTFYWASTDLFSARPISLLLEYEVEFRVPADTALTVSADVDPDPKLLAKQVVELQRVLGLTGRMQNRVPRPPALSLTAETSPDSETKDGYIRVSEESVTAPQGQVAQQPKPARANAPATGGLLGSWASVPNTPLSGRPR